MGLKAPGAARALRGGFFGTAGFYVGALTDDTTELSGGGYARIAQTDAARWELSGGWYRNRDALNFPTPSATLAAPVLSGIWSAATAGDLLATADLAGDPAAPAIGGAFRYPAEMLRIRFDSSGSSITAAGSTEAFLRGLVGSTGTTRYVTLHSAAPGANGANQAGAAVAVGYDVWEAVPSAAQSIRNASAIEFGVQSADLPDVMWVAIRASAASNAAVYWSRTLANNPDDPEIGDRLTIPAQGLTLTATID